MRDALGPGTVLGYCTNVHAGVTLDETKSNLRKHAVPVKQLVSADEPMGVGLWLAEPAARQLLEDDRVGELRDFLGEHGLLAYTFNGFPQGDFHQQVVKHRVYEPDWSDPDRLSYTKQLIEILSGLLPDDATQGSISTLPVGWKTVTGERVEAAARNLLDVAEHLRRLEQETGTLIHLDLEPEPGCFLQWSSDVVRFFTEHLLGGSGGSGGSGGTDAARYLRVCHDVCHAAVWFEDQQEIIDRYDAAGVSIGKVQVSSAVRLDFDALMPDQYAKATAQLRQFHEPRYLHQTVVRDAGGVAVFYEDLPLALAAFDDQTPAGEWRVHFHVPIFLERIEFVETTREHIVQCLQLFEGRGISHWEVETYAWDVLPELLRRETLADGIADELKWLRQVAGNPVT